MNVLGIDSSTKYLSVAVSRDGRIISEVISRGGRGHMVNIMGMLDKALKKSKLGLKDIDVFGVNHGPGDFTGTRIGVTVIKMLSYLEGKPAFGINSLDAVTVGMVLNNINLIAGCLKRDVSPFMMPCLDVRKKEVYFAFYSVYPEAVSDKDCIGGIDLKKDRFFIKRKGERYLVRYDKLEAFLDKLWSGNVSGVTGISAEHGSQVILIGGNCHLSYRETLARIIRKDSIFKLDKKTVYPRSGYVNVCAYYNFLNKVKVKNLTSFYVREFIPFVVNDKDNSSM